MAFTEPKGLGERQNAKMIPKQWQPPILTSESRIFSRSRSGAAEKPKRPRCRSQQPAARAGGNHTARVKCGKLRRQQGNMKTTGRFWGRYFNFRAQRNYWHDFGQRATEGQGRIFHMETFKVSMFWPFPSPETPLLLTGFRAGKHQCRNLNRSLPPLDQHMPAVHVPEAPPKSQAVFKCICPAFSVRLPSLTLLLSLVVFKIHLLHAGHLRRLPAPLTLFFRPG